MITIIRRSLLLLIIILPAHLVSASAVRYPVSDIPKELIENSDAVYREYQVKVKVNSPGSLTVNRKVVITILKESGVGESILSVGYDKLIRVGSISGTIYDAAGEKVRTIRTTDILDYSASDGFSLYSDNRVKHIDPKYYNYPFTIEYEFDLSLKSALFLPDFYLFQGYNIAVENALFQISTPGDFNIHIKEGGGITPCVIGKENSDIVYTWQQSGFAARNAEPLSIDPSYLYPFVMTASNNFEYEAYSGTTNSWESFGLFFKSLNEGKQDLPVPTILLMQKLISGSPSTRESVRRIYNYSQTKNRYVSIQEGIGGIQPFDALTVDRLSYGDCKALTNYVNALLMSVGIKSYYTLIQAGSVIEPVFPDFVTDYFNHIVLCVPNDGDTIWLECTNPYLPSGYVGSFTDDRHALIITEEGGKLTKTPTYNHENNTSSNISHFNLTSDGNGKLSIIGRYSGTYYWSELQNTILDASDRERVLVRTIPMQDIAIKKYEYLIDSVKSGNLIRKLDVDIKNCASFMGDLMLIPSDPVNRPLSVPPAARKRESPVDIQRNILKTDSLFVHIPDGWTLAEVPEDLKISNEMASYSVKVSQEDSVLLIIKSIQMNKGIYPSEKYIGLRDFYEKVSAKEGEMLVLKKKVAVTDVVLLLR